jgi:redox-sensitive bicupin YhaK (pirin superfamily)
MLPKLLVLTVSLAILSTNKALDTMTSFRTVKRILPRPPKHWVGDGFNVYPVFANLAFTKEVTPMLMFDYAAPKEFPVNKGKPLGVGQHPHRGFETVTIAFEGEVEHHDSNGGHGIIFPGDVQWMTAGKGIIHQEYHSKEFGARGGTFEMCQLWVNLPKKHKMAKPRYQAITDSSIPVVDLDHGAKARVIAGSLKDVSGPAKTFSPVNLWDIALPEKETTVEIDYPTEHACIVFCRRGSVAVGGKKLGPQDVAILNMDQGATKVQLNVLQKDSSVLIMGGEPIDEPIANMGPFVMNTELEIQQAIMDYQNGRFGK